MTHSTRCAALSSHRVAGLPRGRSQGPWVKVASANFELYTTAGERSGSEPA